MTARQATQNAADAGPLTDEQRDLIDAHWRAANYLPVDPGILLVLLRDGRASVAEAVAEVVGS